MVDVPEQQVVEIMPDVSLRDLLRALQDVMRRAHMFSHHHVQRETLSVRERMGEVLTRLQDNEFASFAACFRPEEGRMGVVVTFLAILELVKESLIELVQAEPYAPIHIRIASRHDEATTDAGNAAAPEPNLLTE